MLVLAFACLAPPGTEAPKADPVSETTGATPLTAISFNVESGDAFVDEIAEVIAEESDVHVWGLQEVESAWVDALTEAASAGTGRPFQSIKGTTGGTDRLVILFDSERFTLDSYTELDHINVGGSVRAPLVAELIDTENDLTLLLMVNHLWRTQSNSRHTQARLLNDWASSQELPVVAIGDYNFDWDVENGESDHDDGYDLLTEDDVWVWVRPDELVATQCSYSYDGVLDFAFVAQKARSWTGTSEILHQEDSYCRDTQYTSDHRPVKVTLTP